MDSDHKRKISESMKGNCNAGKPAHCRLCGTRTPARLAAANLGLCSSEKCTQWKSSLRRALKRTTLNEQTRRHAKNNPMAAFRARLQHAANRRVVSFQAKQSKPAATWSEAFAFCLNQLKNERRRQGENPWNKRLSAMAQDWKRKIRQSLAALCSTS